MSYLAKVLHPGETVLCQSKIHWLIYLPAVLLLVVTLALLVLSALVDESSGDYRHVAAMAAAAFTGVVALAYWFRAFLRRVSTELAVTDRRVIYKTGLLSRHTVEINRSKVESVDVEQTVMGRIFDYGTILVRGTGGTLEPVRDVENPLTFRSAITAG